MKARIFAFAEVLFLIGATIAPFFVDNQYLLTLSIVLAILALIGRLFYKKWFILLGISLLFLSIFLFKVREVKYSNLNHENAGKEKSYTGTIVSPPEEKEFSQKFELFIEKEDAKLVAYAKKQEPLTYGQIIETKGSIKQYGESKNYLIKEGVFGEYQVQEVKLLGSSNDWQVKAKGILFNIRERFNVALQETLPEAEASLASGLLLGEKQFIGAGFNRLLQASGTSHIIALSGYNITIIIGLLAVFSSRLSRRLQLALIIAFVTLFVIMTGGSASVIRASIMGVMPVLARYFGRSSSSFFAIIFSSFLMVLVNPFILLYDVGFQLSFIAVTGMLYLGPVIIRFLSTFPEYFSKTLGETLGAQIAVLPLLLYYFGYASLVSPISNVIILGLVPFAMLASFILGLVQLFVPILSPIFVFPAYALLHLIISLIEYFGRLPFALYQQEITNPYIIVLCYLFFIDLLFLIRRYGKKIEEEPD
jgi:competence protein ComEC